MQDAKVRRSRRPYLLAIIPLLAVRLIAGSANEGDKFVPYAGSLDGTVTLDFTAPGGPTMTCDIAENSRHLGEGTQVFTTIDLSGFPAVASGTSEAEGANGDKIFLQFDLFATGYDVTPTGFVLSYDGVYHVTGGSGRFDFQQPTSTGDYGSGVIKGAAGVNLATPGVLILSFANMFEGTIATVGGSK